MIAEEIIISSIYHARQTNHGRRHRKQGICPTAQRFTSGCEAYSPVRL